MPKVELAKDLVPIGRFKSQAASLLKAISDEGRTLVITQNGKAAAVVISPEAFDELQTRKQLVEEIAQGLADVDAGRTQTTEQVRKSLARSRQERKRR